MANPSNLNDIIQRILNGNQSDADVEALRQWLNTGGIQNLQVGKYNVNIGQGQDIHIGDRTYQGLDAEAIREVARSVLQGSNAADIREIVRSILKEEFPNLAQRENPQSSSGNSRTPEENLQSILNNVRVGGHLSIGHITQIYGAGEVIQPVNTSEDSPLTNTGNSVDDLVQQVRSHIHDNIQSLHGTMPLWGIDHCVSLGELFVDVNILESLSSSRRSERDDLWQDFITGNSDYRSLDRIGLGKERERVSGLTVVERNTNLMVVGKPGSGKTTYLQRIVTECNAGKLQAQRIPVLIKLRYFVDDGHKYEYNLEQFLGQLWQLRNTDIELVLSQGRALVLLDGLDEVTGEALKQIAKEIKRFARIYPQVQVVVTCRTQSQESRFERFDYVEVADFNEEQVRAFTAHWFGTVCADAGKGETKAREFFKQLFREENKAIRELAITPILLSLTCAVFQQTGKFYSKRSKLYEEGLELLLVQWDKSRSVERDEVYRDLSVERKLELLSYVAVKKFEQEQYVLFEQEELQGYIGEFLGIEQRDSRGVLRAIESQHGLLIERAQKVWSFSHLTFQEYLVAKWFVENTDYQSLVNYILQPHWREVFILAVLKMGVADELLYLMNQRIYDFLVEDKKLQHFLHWLDKKAKSVNVPYKLAAVRGFYFVLARALIYASACAYTMTCELALSFASSIDSSVHLIDIPAFNVDLALAHAHDQAYCNNLISVQDLNFDFNNPHILNIDAELKQKLEEIRKELPITSHEGFKIWWQIQGKAWTKKLRNIMLEHRNIGRDWHFTKQQKKMLEQYYNVNQLLLNCLQSSCTISDTARKEIEESLLLPIAEIEKRKREDCVSLY
ncbi:NACHT domain-containing NTPase [Brasilonema sp. CT11]|nr:NACHT domain-containing NTPase [Brasilonema sp. CT11]